MLLYESGMSYPKHLSCLMEMDRNASYRLCVMLDLAREQVPVIERYQRTIIKYFQAKGMKGYAPLASNILHISLFEPFLGSQLLQNSLKSLDQSIRELTLPYDDTDSDDEWLLVSLRITPEIEQARQLISKTFSRLTLSGGYHPHMSLGRNPPDTPDESVTANPGFSRLTFRNLRVTAMPVAA